METESKGVILVVDDNPENLGVLFDYLDQSGFTVLLVQNGKNALKQAEDNIPDLILLDVMMPDLDGFEVCRRLKAYKVTKDIPVIFMTALSETVDKVKGFEVGGVDYITKPIRHQEVFARVQAHLTIRKLQQELQEKNITLEKYVALLTEKNAQLEEKNVQLDEKNLQLQEANTSKDRFFSIISHDLRAPFVGLLGLTQIVVEEFETYTRDEIKNMLVNLQETSRTLYTLLGNLLTWSRIQRGMIENNPQEMDVQEVIVRNVRLFNSNAEQKQITLKNLLHELTVVYADERMVHTIIRNLISNAVKFTHPGGNVTVSAEQEENTVTVSVSDTGIGIGEKHIPKLFRIDAKYKRPGTAEEQGTGLGLVLCKEFVERSGGKIWVESTIDKGTTFRFTLPKKPVE